MKLILKFYKNASDQEPTDSKPEDQSLFSTFSSFSGSVMVMVRDWLQMYPNGKVELTK